MAFPTHVNPIKESKPLAKNESANYFSADDLQKASRAHMRPQNPFFTSQVFAVNRYRLALKVQAPDCVQFTQFFVWLMTDIVFSGASRPAAGRSYLVNHPTLQLVLLPL